MRVIDNFFDNTPSINSLGIIDRERITGLVNHKDRSGILINYAAFNGRIIGKTLILPSGMVLHEERTVQ